jgi:DNA replication protein DnaC
MITIKNILNEYPRIKQSSLPYPYKNEDFEEIKKMLHFYDKDNEIKNYIDYFIEDLNRFNLKYSDNSTSTKTKVKPMESKETKPDKATKKKLKTGRKLAKKMATKAKVKPVKVIKAETPIKQAKTMIKREAKAVLTNIPAWLMTIRKFTGMANKEYAQRTLRSFLKDIQTKFTAKREGAATPHIDLIKKIQLTVVTSVNEQLKKDKIKLKANTALVAECKAISHNYKVKQVKETNTVNVEPLKGTNLSGFGIVSSQDLAKMNFKTLEFTGKYKDLIGNPTIPFQIMVYGLPGSGKSTLGINLAKYLADGHQMKVLYLAKEEGISGTSQEKFIRLNAVHPNIDITEKMPENLNNYDVLVIDSVNEMNMTPDNIRSILVNNPRLSTIQVFKATKEGKFLGQSDFAHLCQAEIRCFDGKAQAQKNRFGGNKEIVII